MRPAFFSVIRDEHRYFALDLDATNSAAPGSVPGGEVTQGQKNAAERLIPFNSYLGARQLLRYFVNEPGD